MTESPRPLIGLVGGLGPRASSAFLQTIYNASDLPDQLQPRIILWSDPSIPDRSNALLNGGRASLERAVREAVMALDDCGVEAIIVCCVTAHAVLNEVAAACRAPIVSLVDFLVEDLVRTAEPHLLACTNGTRAAGVFDQHPRREEFAELLVLPEPSDQQTIHDLLYELKVGGDVDAAASCLAAIAHRYDTAGIAAGCTELHLLHAAKALRGTIALLDPLATIGADIDVVLKPTGERTYQCVE